MKVIQCLLPVVFAAVSGCGGSSADGVNASGVALTSAPTIATTLTSSLSSLVLVVNNPLQSAFLSGTPRRITVTNTGSVTASAVGYAISSALPAGTTVTPRNCGSLAPGATCVLTVTPGAVPSAVAGDPDPTAVTLTIGGTNTNSLGVSVAVLTYGSVHQSGFVFSVDDTTPDTRSATGKVAALADRSAALPWSNAFDDISGIRETSARPASACNGSLDGKCNSVAILAFYPAVDPKTYAAGSCSANINGYSDWYLPSICELGYDLFQSGSGCGTPSAAPALQNMQSGLIDRDLGGFNGFMSYWSSTEHAGGAGATAWVSAPVTGAKNGSAQFAMRKSSNLPVVRCARAITP
jgi:hypothetical protein